MIDLPQAFQDRMREMLGEEYQDFIDSYEKPRQYGLRVNTLKLTPEEFEAITPFELRRVPWVENGYFYREGDLPSKHPHYFAGLYYMQEPSAMSPAARLPIEPGDRVLDLCAAPGGKATELGAALKGTGLLVANEISASRVKALLKNIELMGIGNSFITNEKPGNLTPHFEEFFDKILVDAPCSGEGMFRKEVEVIGTWDEERPAYFAKLQKDILDQAFAMLKPGGLLLYSTCTFSKEENEGSIGGFLERHPQMQMEEIKPWEGFSPGVPEWGGGNPELAKSVRIWPHRMPGEGHFMALMRKKGEWTANEKPQGKKRPFAGTGKQQRKLLEEFFSQVKTEAFSLDVEIRGDKVYQNSAVKQELRGIRFLRNGLYLGDIKKNRFEPSQAFAMALREEEFSQVLNLDSEDERVERYLKGETILVEEGETSSGNGWYLVCVDHYPLGWGKLVGVILKNKYLNAWRKN